MVHKGEYAFIIWGFVFANKDTQDTRPVNQVESWRGDQVRGENHLLGSDLALALHPGRQ